MSKGAAMFIAPRWFPQLRLGPLDQKGHIGSLMRTVGSPTCAPLVPPAKVPYQSFLKFCFGFPQ